MNEQASVYDANGNDAHGCDFIGAIESESEKVFTAAGPVAYENLIGVRGSANGDFINTNT